MTVYYSFGNIDDRLNVLTEVLATGGCFGALNQSSFPHYAFHKVRRSNDPDRDVGSSAASQRAMTTPNNFVFHVLGDPTVRVTNSRYRGDFYQGYRALAEAQGVTVNRYIYEMLVELFEDIPFYRDLVDFEYMDVNSFGAVNMYFNITDETPADKVITAAFLARNIAHFGEGRTYQNMLSLGYTPFFSAIVSSMVQFRPDNGVNPFGGERLGVATSLTAGEYNWFHPRGIGREGVIRLLSGEEPEWALESWNSLRGYRRENHFSNNNMTVNGRPQILIDWATVPGDTEHFIEDFSFDRGRGMFNVNQMNYIRLDRNIRNFAELLRSDYNIDVFQQEAE